ncbi:CocE/NonD family hydrolase [Paractinoplanes lichenicola]|uniref:Xaa-Pro dipeptidyl-peptidase n=1 Tax=Paractinoplanes lichenicola TaxID=2802976 RepID=A0ABS1VFN2_9ACTN|nr:CocE/NonD family hydrolase [Actinoplanes lichenicola]MBL7253125.1 CocE/NonD family hydrolase [Actinoplanes lichenicola]
MTSMRRKLATVISLALIGALVPLAAPASAAPPGDIVEDVWVEVPLDSDGDGVRDRVHLNITRPASDQKVGSIVLPTPYAGPGVDVPYPSVDVDRLPQETPAAGLADVMRGAAKRGQGKAVAAFRHYTNRGYAIITADSLGTNLSTGCPDTGGKDETAAMRAVVDWLDRKGRAYDAAGKPVTATWSLRRVAMSGVSYNGTLPIMAAITGKSALKTIIPMSAVTSWYDYYRANGLVVAPGGWQGEDLDVMSKYILTRENPEVCAAAMDRLTRIQDRVTGDYSRVWAERDYTAQAGKIQASVFVAQGLADWNVKPKQGIQLWSALRGDRKLWLYDGGHGSPQSQEFSDAVDRWIDHYIYGTDNGVNREPRVTLEDADGTVTERTTSWPVPGTRTASLPLTAGPATFTDNGRTQTVEQLIAAESPHRLVYRWPTLPRDVRLSGTPYVDLKVSIDNRTAANLTAVLVDYGPSGADPVIVTRGWIDPQNRASKSHSLPVVPGKKYKIRWDMQPEDYVFKAGHQIGVALLSTDYDYTLRPLPGTQITIDPTASRLDLPIVGGRQALGF